MKLKNIKPIAFMFVLLMNIYHPVRGQTYYPFPTDSTTWNQVTFDQGNYRNVQCSISFRKNWRVFKHCKIHKKIIANEYKQSDKSSCFSF